MLIISLDFFANDPRYVTVKFRYIRLIVMVIGLQVINVQSTEYTAVQLYISFVQIVLRISLAENHMLKLS